MIQRVAVTLQVFKDTGDPTAAMTITSSDVIVTVKGVGMFRIARGSQDLWPLTGIKKACQKTELTPAAQSIACEEIMQMWRAT